MRLLTLICVFGASLSLPVQQDQDQVQDSDEDGSRKLLGSSVVTSVSVILDTGNGTQAIFSDAVGHPMLKPNTASQVASPIDFLHPDRYEFYTFDDSGDLVKRLMTLNEIQGIIANGDGEANNYNSLPPEEYNPEKKVNDVVENVQNVLKEQMEVMKSNLSGTNPVLDTPDVSSTWSMILPAIFGNSGEDIAPAKAPVQATPETIMLDQTVVNVQPDIISSSILIPGVSEKRPEDAETVTVPPTPIEASSIDTSFTPEIVFDVISTVSQHAQEVMNALSSTTGEPSISTEETEIIVEQTTQVPKRITTTPRIISSSAATTKEPITTTSQLSSTETAEIVKTTVFTTVPQPSTTTIRPTTKTTTSRTTTSRITTPRTTRPRTTRPRTTRPRTTTSSTTTPSTTIPSTATPSTTTPSTTTPSTTTPSTTTPSTTTLSATTPSTTTPSTTTPSTTTPSTTTPSTTTPSTTTPSITTPSTTTLSTENPTVVSTTPVTATNEKGIPTTSKVTTISTTEIVSKPEAVATTEITKLITTMKITNAPKEEITTKLNDLEIEVTTAEIPFTTFFSVDSVKPESDSVAKDSTTTRVETTSELLQTSSSQNIVYSSTSNLPKVTTSGLNTKATTVHITTPSGTTVSGVSTVTESSAENRPDVSVVNNAQTGVIPNRKNVTSTTQNGEPQKVTPDYSMLSVEHRLGSTTIGESVQTTPSTVATSTTTKRIATTRRRYNITDSPIIIITELNKGSYPVTINPAALFTSRPSSSAPTTVKTTLSTTTSPITAQTVVEPVITASTVQKINAMKPSSTETLRPITVTTEFPLTIDVKKTTVAETHQEVPTVSSTEQTKYTKIQTIDPAKNVISSTTNKISTSATRVTTEKPKVTSTSGEKYDVTEKLVSTTENEVLTTTETPEDGSFAVDAKHDDVDFENDSDETEEDNLIPAATNSVTTQIPTKEEEVQATEFNMLSTQNMISSFEQIIAQTLQNGEFNHSIPIQESITSTVPIHDYLFQSTTDPSFGYRGTDTPEIDTTNAEFDKAVSSLIYQIVKEPNSIIKEFFSTTTENEEEKISTTSVPVPETSTTETETFTTPTQYTDEPMALFFNRFGDVNDQNSEDERFQMETTTEAEVKVTEIISAIPDKASEEFVNINADIMHTTSLRPQSKVTAKADLSLEFDDEEGYIKLETSIPTENIVSATTTSATLPSSSYSTSTASTTEVPETTTDSFIAVTTSNVFPTSEVKLSETTTADMEVSPEMEVTTVLPVEITTFSTLATEKMTTTTRVTDDVATHTSWTLVPTIDPHQSNSVAIVTTTEEAKPTPETSAPVNLISEPVQGLEASTSRLEPDIYEFAELCNEIAFKFWQSVTTMGISSARSVFVSPFATTSLLAMVFLGARGATSGEMNEILKLDEMVTFNPHLIFKNVSESIDASLNPGVATSLIVRELFSDRSKGKLLNFYKDRARYFYDGHVEEAGFKRIGDVIRRRTSLIVKRMTNGKINEFVKDASITVRPPLAAISSSIFQTDCSKASTEGRDGELYFVVLPSIRQRRLVPVPAVVYRSNFLAGYDPSLDATAVSLGTKEDTVSTIFVIPGQQGIAAPGDGLTRLEQRLVDISFKTGSWNRLLRTLVPRPGLEVQIPRFSHRSIVNATVALQRMGLKELFDTQKADLRGLNGVAHELHLSDMLQMNQFSMCAENGLDESHHSEIYPATANRAYRTSRLVRNEFSYDYSEEPRDYQRSYHDPLHDPSLLSLPLSLRPRQARVPAAPRLRFDRPFLYFVRHNPTGLILHMGRFNPRLLP